MTKVSSGARHTEVLWGGRHAFEVHSGGVCDLVVWGGAQVTVSLVGPGAQCRVRGLVIENGAEKTEVRCEVRHMAPNCTSEQLFRAVVGGPSVAHFCGMIFVAPGAVGTSASQYSNGILMSDDAKVLSDPQMEVYADDVKCNHGATVGGRDEQALFYMRQRGIPMADAQKLLLESFCFSVVDGMSLQEADNQELTRAITAKIKGL